MTVLTREISFQTKGNVDIIDLTDKVAESLRESQLNDGILTAFVPGSTGAITTVEYEPGVLEDMKNALERMMPQGIEYKHNLRWGDGNGHSHVRASMMGPSLTVPFSNKKLLIGTWQQIVFIDLDVRPRSRRIIVQIMGE
ncbi:MAG: secondary thiamine-phosphate synthase enzyme YjbQ [Methanocellales archaeon]|nr:secondary thiamine-phosphate synthase enzyme YjbQ [Methanocellales archaeon]MDD3291413.1 secondary thiamine-phosphate synthase enzyme YjbQ [Methanocellales archaeon]MDD5234697.1 secondary thiamine-phosphate synthase enzyme YjbQ [Methanocellales archaeon]MDD5484952.1 secondary thiamine-phosphate synthase enzyme YjbQ [Methanocellales archaeon]